MNIETKNLWKKSASEIIALINKKEISKEEVLDSSLNRIKEVNPDMAILKFFKLLIWSKVSLGNQLTPIHPVIAPETRNKTRINKSAIYLGYA